MQEKSVSATFQAIVLEKPTIDEHELLKRKRFKKVKMINPFQNIELKLYIDKTNEIGVEVRAKQ